MQKIYLLFLFISFANVSRSQSANELVSITDMLKIKTVGSVTLTKDGSKAAFTVNAIEPDEKSKLDYKFVTQIYSINTTKGSVPLQLTSAKEGASQPAWSPNGKQLAFVRTVAEKPQIFILSMDGGEATQLTRSKYGAASPKWSPDGKQILYSSAITFNELLTDSTLNAKNEVPNWPFEKPGFEKNSHLKTGTAKPNPNGNMAEIRAYLDTNASNKKAIVLNKLNFQSESNISSDQSFNQFFIIDVQKKSEPVLITKGFNRLNNAAFTPNGEQIYFSGDVDSLESPDRSLESEIFIADKNGQNFRMIIGEAGKNYSNPAVSSSGKMMAFSYGTTSFVNVPALAIMPLNGSAKDITIIPFDRNKADFTWSADDKFLYFTSPSNGANVLYRLTVATKKIDALSDFTSGVTSYDIVNNNIVFSKTQVSNPSELYVADADFKNQTQVSNFNDWVKTKKLSYPLKQTFKNEKGLEVEYWVMKPTNYQAGNKYPLLLEIHGGPTAMWGPGEASMWHEFQYFCSRGYGVVYSNPRGSGGYGETFLRANIKDWGTGPASDVLTALDKTVAEGWADTSKLLITGGSYAGYLTAWIISHDNRFRAACAQRGVYDLTTFFGEGNAWRLVPNYFGGYPWEPTVKANLLRESPFNYVQNIKTPFIIFHGGNDRRTGFVQGEMMYRSLKVLGRPVEYVVHPGATHEITRSGDNRQRIDQMLRTYEFFERYLSK